MSARIIACMCGWCSKAFNFPDGCDVALCPFCKKAVSKPSLRIQPSIGSKLPPTAPISARSPAVAGKVFSPAAITPGIAVPAPGRADTVAAPLHLRPSVSLQPVPIPATRICRACTFINHADRTTCEICEAPLSAKPMLNPPTVPPLQEPASSALRVAAATSSATCGKATAVTIPSPVAAAPIPGKLQLLRATSAGTILDDFSCTKEEELAADDAYTSIIRSICGQGSTTGAAALPAARKWTDPAFPPGQASLNGVLDSAEAKATMQLTSATGKSVEKRVPVVWRRPDDMSDENRQYALQAKNVAPAALVEIAGLRPGITPTLARANSTADDDCLYSFPRSDLQFLADYAKATPVKCDPPWAFRRGPFSAGDVKQGSLGTCWFVSALAVVAERHDVIRRLFRTRPLAHALVDPAGTTATLAPVLLHSAEDVVHDSVKTFEVPLNPLGVYQLRFCIGGLWHVVTIDDHIPTNSVTGSAAFSSSLRRQLWAALVEKAASKAAGSYAALTSGNVGEGLRLLTGAPTAEYFVRTNELGTERRERKCMIPSPIIAWEYDFAAIIPARVVEAAWARLLSLHQSRFPMGVSSTSPSVDDYPRTAKPHEILAKRAAQMQAAGIAMDHAYSILQLVEKGGKRFLQLRNPWSNGKSCWTGAWSDGSKDWQAVPALEAELGPHLQAEHGVFWMSIQDFVQIFVRVDIARVRDPATGWSTVRIQIPELHGDRQVTVLRMRPTRNTVVELEYNQYVRGTLTSDAFSSVRYVRNSESTAKDIGLAIVQEVSAPAGACGLATQLTGMKYTAGLLRCKELYSDCETALEEGEQYFVVPTTLAAYRDSGTSGGASPPGFEDCGVVVVHSEHPVLIEVVTKPLSWFSRALACQVVSVGSESSFSAATSKAGVRSFNLTDGCGCMVVAANLSFDTGLQFGLRWTKLSGYAPTRGESTKGRVDTDIEYTDVLAPRSVQLISALVPVGGVMRRSWGSSYKISYGATTMLAPTLHVPAISAGSIHAAFPVWES